MEKTTKGTKVWIVSLLVLFLSCGGQAMAAKGSPGPPDGSGPGDHGRTKDSDEQGTLMGLIFGDQWVVVRDVSAAGDGRPVYFTWTWPAEAYNAEGDFEPDPSDPLTYPVSVAISAEGSGCVQPISFDPLLDPADVSEYLPDTEQFMVGDYQATYYDSYGREKLAYMIPLDAECKVPEAFEESWGTQVMEADAGRFNLSRSPQDVLDAAYEEVLLTINQASWFGLDPAGRLLLELPIIDEYGPTGDFTTKTIDSPRENLALYQRIMWDGCLADTDNIVLADETKALLIGGDLGHLICDGTLPDNDDFRRAASFLAGAGDKSGRVTLDLIVYLNDRLELNEIIWAANKKEIEDIIYYDFQTFSYDRCDEHAVTTADLLQPDPGDPPTMYHVATGVTLFDKRFVYSWPTEPCSAPGGPYSLSAAIDADTPIINFVRAADDALVIIDYIHNYELPAYPLNPISEGD